MNERFTTKFIKNLLYMRVINTVENGLELHEGCKEVNLRGRHFWRYFLTDFFYSKSKEVKRKEFSFFIILSFYAYKYKKIAHCYVLNKNKYCP